MRVLGTIFSWAVRVLVVCAIFGIPAALFYLQVVGADESWRARLGEAIGGDRMRVEIGRLTFRIFEGVVAEDVIVTAREHTDLRIADISRLEVALDYAALLRGKVSVDSLILNNSSLRIPFADDGRLPDAIEVEGATARIYGSGGHLRVYDAEFVLEGVRVRATGLAENLGQARLALTAESDPEAEAARVRLIRSLVSEIRTIPFADGERPDLRFEFRADLARLPDSLQIKDIAFRMGEATIRGLRIQTVRLEAAYAESTLNVPRFEIGGQQVDLRMSGWWNPAMGAEVDLFGRADVPAVLDAFGSDVLPEEVIFESKPEVEATLRGSPGDGDTFAWQASGTLHSGAFQFKGVHGKSVSGAFAWRDGSVFLKDAVIQLTTGSLKADVLSRPGDFRLRLHSNIIPTEIAGVLGPKERALMDVMEFGEAPDVQVELSGPAPDFNELSGSGKMKLGRTAMRGSWIDHGETRLVFGDRAVRYEDMTIARGTGQGTGSFVYDFGRREVRLENVVADLMPENVLLWIDPRIAKTVSAYRFRAAPNVKADGLVHMADPSKNALSVEVDAPAGLDYELLGRDLRFGHTKAEVRLVGREVLADISKAELFGGNAGINARVSIDPGNPVFGADIDLDSLDFPALTKLYFDYERAKGSMSGTYSFTARLDDPGDMKGSGQIRVEQGHVLSIPIFGPLSEVISTIIPGVGHDPASLATAAFAVANRRVSTENLEIVGNGFTLFLEGDVAYPSGQMDMTARINARGVSGIVLFPVSKLLEYVSTGNMADPQWRPKIIPREFFQLLGDPGPAAASGEARPPARPATTGNKRGPRGRR